MDDHVALEAKLSGANDKLDNAHEWFVKHQARIASLEAALRTLVKQDWRNVSEWDAYATARALLTQSETFAEPTAEQRKSEPEHQAQMKWARDAVSNVVIPQVFEPIGDGIICRHCNHTIGYHCQTAEGDLFCEVPQANRGGVK